MDKNAWAALPVQDGVAIPKQTRKGSSPVAEKLLSLSPGQSFVVPKKQSQNVINQFRNIYGLNSYTSRPGEQEGTVRFWRN